MIFINVHLFQPKIWISRYLHIFIFYLLELFFVLNACFVAMFEHSECHVTFVFEIACF